MAWQRTLPHRITTKWVLSSKATTQGVVWSVTITRFLDNAFGRLIPAPANFVGKPLPLKHFPPPLTLLTLIVTPCSCRRRFARYRGPYGRIEY